MVLERVEIDVCATASARNVYRIIPTPLGFMLSGRVIQALSVFRLIMNIGSCQERPIQIMGLMGDLLEEEGLKSATWLITIWQLSLS